MDPAVSTAFSRSLPDEAVETANGFALRSTWLKPGVNETSGKRAVKTQKSSGNFFGSSMHSFTLTRNVTASFPSMARWS